MMFIIEAYIVWTSLIDEFENDDAVVTKVLIAAKKLIDANIVLFDDAWTTVSSVFILIKKAAENAAASFILISYLSHLSE